MKSAACILVIVLLAALPGCGKAQITALPLPSPPTLSEQAFRRAEKAREKGIALVRRARAGGGFTAESGRQAAAKMEEARRLFQEALPARPPEAAAGIRELEGLIFWTWKTTPWGPGGRDGAPLAPPATPAAFPGGMRYWENFSAEELKKKARLAYEFACQYENEHSDDPFLVEAQFFAVARQFQRTDAGGEAMEKVIHYHELALAQKEKEKKAGQPAP